MAEGKTLPTTLALVLHHCRHGVESAEIIPAVESDHTVGDTSTANGAVFVKTVIFQVIMMLTQSP